MDIKKKNIVSWAIREGDELLIEVFDHKIKLQHRTQNNTGRVTGAWAIYLPENIVTFIEMFGTANAEDACNMAEEKLIRKLGFDTDVTETPESVIEPATTDMEPVAEPVDNTVAGDAVPVPAEIIDESVQESGSQPELHAGGDLFNKEIPALVVGVEENTVHAFSLIDEENFEMAPDGFPFLFTGLEFTAVDDGNGFKCKEVTGAIDVVGAVVDVKKTPNSTWYKITTADSNTELIVVVPAGVLEFTPGTQVKVTGKFKDIAGKTVLVASTIEAAE